MPQKKKLPLISLKLKKTFMTGHCFQINKMYYNIRSTQAKAIALSYWIVVIDCLPTVRNSINYFLSLRGWGSTPDVPISCYSVTLCPLHFFIIQRLCIIGPLITDVTMFTTLPGCHLLLQSDFRCLASYMCGLLCFGKKMLLVESGRGF